MSSTTLDQKKNIHESESNDGTSPNNVPKPDTYGFIQQFSITTIQVLFYVGIIGTMGAYTVKSAAAQSVQSCSTELFSGTIGILPDCKNMSALGPTPPFLNAAKTSVVARYFSKVFAEVFYANTSFITQFSSWMKNLPNWAILLLYSIISIPFFLILWIYNWITNVFFAIQQLPLLFSEKNNCKAEPTLFTTGVKKNCDSQKWQHGSMLSWKIIPVCIYLCFIGLTTFFSSLYTTIVSLFSPLMLNFVLNSKKYGFGNFIPDMITTNRTLWLILFSLTLLSNTNTYLGTNYTAAAFVAILVAYIKM